MCNSCQSFKLHWPLSPKPFNFGYVCFGIFRYSLTQGTPSLSLVRSSCYTLYIYIYIYVCVCKYSSQYGDSGRVNEIKSYLGQQWIPLAKEIFFACHWFGKAPLDGGGSSALYAGRFAFVKSLFPLPCKHHSQSAEPWTIYCPCRELKHDFTFFFFKSVEQHTCGVRVLNFKKISHC